MKTKRLSSTITKVTMGLLLTAVVLYFILPELAVNTGRILEMIQQGASNDVASVFGSLHPYDPFFAGFINVIQILGVIFNRGILNSTCIQHFGPIIGKAVLILSGALSIFMAYGIGYGIRTLMGKITVGEKLLGKVPESKGKLEIVLLLLAFNVFMVNFAWISILLYVMGFFEVNFRKLMLVACIGLLLL